ncbi:hypothetical protein OG562_22370 [Streptomyces sp. NBC_01275]|uniref:hypothetical protein n=1 Tax=Streptomyces sp. NBC_01275 TaxID=2903807 RepID=UPI0022530703|nr:hypothetical protein [Streptomyces sp. NBC_01275]MCX4763657.1 hypothetical protein [Streptomyces sp. NBC_01275]
MRSQIWVGDAVRALKVARTPGEQAHVLEMLGFAPAVVPATDRGTPFAAPDGSRTPVETPRQERDPEPDHEPPPSPADDDGTETVDVTEELPLLRPTRVEPVQAPREPVEPLARPTSERAPLPHQPLFVPAWTSAVLRAMISRRVPEGAVDLSSLVDTLAHGRPVGRLPRLPVPTMRYGVQVLVDRGTGMQPFRRDQNHLLERIRAVVGPSLVEVGYFSGAPQRGTGPGARWTRTAYAPPESGRPVLLLSDLGLGGPPDDPQRGAREDWEHFVGLVTRAGCGVVALSPYPPRRWPRWMTSLLPLVSWDRTTTAARAAVRLP